MKARRIAVVVISAVVVSLVTLLVGLVTNVASSEQRWPGWLAPLQENPWGWFGGIAAVAVVLAVVGAVLAERSAGPEPALAGAPTPGGAPDTVKVFKALPRDIASFTNRGAELKALHEEVNQALRSSEVIPILAIDGMPGTGKTAFAIHAGHALAGQFDGGQVFLNLNGHTAGLRPVDPCDALAALLLADGVNAQRLPTGTDGYAVTQARAALWRDRLAGRRMLMILDNAESYSQVEPLLPGDGSSLVVITSRRRLAIPDGDSVPLGELPEEDAAALFLKLSRRREPPSDATVREIVALCGRLPLAISLLATQWRNHPVWTAEQLLKRLRAAQSRLGEMRAGSRAVKSAFDVSFQALTADLQHLFRYVGVFPGVDIDHFAVAALTGAAAEDVRRRLAGLYEDHLLGEVSPDRYRLHDLLRDYAQELAEAVEGEERTMAIDRLVAYYSAALENANHLIDRVAATAEPEERDDTMPALRNRAEALDWLAAERANVLNTIQHAQAHGDPLGAVRLAAAMGPFLRHAGPWDQAAQLYRTAAELARGLGDREAEAGALANLGVVSRLMADYPTASEALNQAIDLCREVGDDAGRAVALNQVGIVAYLISDYRAAADAQLEALDICRRLEDKPGQANALADLGMCRRQMSQYREAAEVQGAALELYRELGDLYGQANSLRDLGIIHGIRGEYSTATQLHAEAYDLYVRLGDEVHQAYALNEIGSVHRLAMRDDEALAAYSRALEIYREVGDRFGEANSLRHLAAVKRLAGDREAARDLCRSAQTIYDELGNRSGQAYALIEQGLIVGPPSAVTDFGRAAELFSTLGDRSGECEAQNNSGWALMEVVGPAQAEPYFRAALEISAQISCPLEEARAQRGLARCMLLAGERDEGLELLRRAQSTFRRLGARESGEVSALIEAPESER